MKAKVYPNHALRAEGNNRINLSDAEENTLRKALDQQLQAHHINGLQLQLMQAVFHHTIEFNKLEDDMTGTFLEKVVGSRYDYCNKNISTLIEQSMLISRKGHYGRILSINYHFEDWGKKPQDTPNKSADPKTILDQYIPQKAAEKSAENETKGENTPVEQLSNSLLDQALPDEFARLISQDVLDSLSTAIAKALKIALEHITPQLLLQMAELTATPNATSNASSNMRVADIQSDNLNSETNTLAEKNSMEPSVTPEQDQEHAQKTLETACKIEVESQKQKSLSETPSEIPEAVSQIASRSEQETQEKPTTIEAPEITTHTPADIINTAEEAAENTCDYDKLIYPEQLKPFEQKHIQNILEKEQIQDEKTAQTLLDSMRSRFSLDMEPIKSPVAYFRSLINSLKTGTFETSYADIFRQQHKEAQTQTINAEAQQKRQENKEKYNNAKNSYETLKLRMKLTGKSMRELAKDLGWTALIEEMGFDLDAQLT